MNLYTEQEYETELSSIVEDLTGSRWAVASTDITGCYHASGHWVSGESICQALREAFDAGHDAGEISSA